MHKAAIGIKFLVKRGLKRCDRASQQGFRVCLAGLLLMIGVIF